MPKDRLETAQLQREIVGVAVHDLGSVAAALTMRAAVPVSALPAQAEGQQAALASLAGQVRTAMQLLDVARVSPQALAMSATGPSVPLSEWLKRWPALGRVAMPRGARLHVEGVEGLRDWSYPLPLATDAVATPVLLCALHALHQPGDVTLMVGPVERGREAMLLCRMQTASRVRSRSRWRRHADHVLGTLDWSFQWWEPGPAGEHKLRITLPLMPAALKESV